MLDARPSSIFIMGTTLLEHASSSFARSESTDRWNAKSEGSPAACLVALRADS